ncbi:MAG TPA: N-6 DNA methylase [Stellaceae bacterium]|nr:N-6 DNA methylase [Stellaceae bacterium]
MYIRTKARPEDEQTLTLIRRVSDLRTIASKLKRARMTPLQVCEAIIERRFAERTVRAFFAELPDDERHYWIASLYALLMPKARRKRLAAYFTPPHLAHHAIRVMMGAGIRPGHHRILDPACGGAAFLVPLAAQVAEAGHERGARAKTIIQDIQKSLHGVEIDGDLAGLSHALLNDLLDDEIENSGLLLDRLVQRADTLRLEKPGELYDAVIGNPPYGRILRPSAALLKRYRPVIADGYVNLYTLFVEQALQWVRPGGVVCLIIPMSFVGGPYFAALRERILQSASVLRLDLIDKRSDVFLDVLYDLCVVLLRKNGGPGRRSTPKSALLRIDEPDLDLGLVDLPAAPNRRVWVLPDVTDNHALFRPGFETLTDYGYLTKTGYFVWNREKHRYRTGKKPRVGEVPLFSAHNVRANQRSEPRDDETSALGFVRISKSSAAVVHSDSVIVQRTSNRRQKRRLIAGIVRQKDAIGARGFVTENHTIIVIPDPTKRQKLSLRTVCRLLNTAAVDARFRRISGSVSVSTKALRELPLPAAADVRKSFAKRKLNDDEAATDAYEASAARKRAAPTPKKARKSSLQRTRS